MSPKAADFLGACGYVNLQHDTFLIQSLLQKQMSSTVKRRRGHSIHLDLAGEHDKLPSIAALFLILFDVKAG